MDSHKKHKVAFIHPDLGIGGAERLVLDVAVALAEKGNEVSFVTNHFDRTHAFQELKDGQFPVRIVGDWIPRSVCGICQALCAYIRMIFLALVYVLYIHKDEKPDVYFIDQIPMAVPFIKWSGGKVVYYCHHPDLLASPPGGKLKKVYRMLIDWLELKCTGLADVILVNSEYTASVFRNTFPEITKDICILYPTISASYQNDIENYKGIKKLNELVPEIKTTENQVVFLSINRYHPAKKLELALSGLEALKDKLSLDDWQRVHLIMAGGYDPQSIINAKYFAELVTAAQQKNLLTKVTFLKSLSDNLKVDLLVACDCLIYTPVNEHFGIVPLEAMIAAKPVIACNSGGPCETVQNEETGFLCEPNGDSLATAMSKLLDKSCALKMGQEGKRRLSKYFSHSVFVNSVNNVVDSVCNINWSSNLNLEINERDTEENITNHEGEQRINSDDDEQINGVNFKNELSPKKQISPEFKNVNEDQPSKRKVENEKSEIVKTEEQSPFKGELQNGVSKENGNENADDNELELNQHGIKDDQTEKSSNKYESKSATASFLQNETDSNNAMFPKNNIEIKDEVLAHNE